ncbi:MAG: hypothetical protein ACI8S6_005171, partial [Myxococcota bacterium]
MTGTVTNTDSLSLCGDDAADFIAAPPRKLSARTLTLDGGAFDPENHPSITEIVLPRYPRLRHLTVMRWPALTSLQVEGRIQGLSLSATGPLSAISPLPHLTELSGIPLHLLSGSLARVREIHSCVIDEEALSCVAELTALKVLNGTSIRFDDLTVLRPLQALTAMRIRGRFTTLLGLEALHRLKDIQVSSPHLHDISALAELRGLRQLELQGCAVLTDISALAGRKLNHINLSGTKVRAAGIPASL